MTHWNLKGRTVSLNLQIHNITDESYRDFLDTYKGYALGNGRNVQFTVQVPIR